MQFPNLGRQKPYRRASLKIRIIDLALTPAYEANTGLRRQLVDQSLGFFEISEPSVNQPYTGASSSRACVKTRSWP
jgi:hypothetical protein